MLNCCNHRQSLDWQIYDHQLIQEKALKVWEIYLPIIEKRWRSQDTSCTLKRKLSVRNVRKYIGFQNILYFRTTSSMDRRVLSCCDQLEGKRDWLIINTVVKGEKGARGAGGAYLESQNLLGYNFPDFIEIILLNSCLLFRSLRRIALVWPNRS